MSRKELVVSALENGTVLDHIPAENVYRALDLLNLKGIENQITIGINLNSKAQGRKGIIKIEGRFFEDDELGKLALIIATCAPFERVQINGIGNTEILERTQELSVNGFRQTDLRRNAVIKVRQHTLAIHTLRSSGQAQQNTRLIIRQQLLIGRRCGMVELIHDDVIIELRRGFCGEVL